MPFDFKKEYKEFYMPNCRPELVKIPKANYIAVRGKGDPNEEGGEYQQAIGVLYAVAYTLKMSYKTDHRIEGFYDYVVPPLEGFWWQECVDGIDYSDKSAFCWISVIRLPDFITEKDFAWAVETASKKKKLDCSKAEFLTMDEGLCVQIMHVGAFDDEPASVALMERYIDENGYENDFSDTRLHHEIYLSDARKVIPEKWKTVIRHPVKKKKTAEEKMIATDRLRIYAASREQMETFIAAQSVDVLKEAYTEMLAGCLAHPDQWEWYAIWMIERKDGTHIGELCFKGLSGDGTAEIGYGIEEEHQGCGYATEAVSAVVDWALNQPGVCRIAAEAEESNAASVRVLEKCGFTRIGIIGEEGPRFARSGK